MRGLAAPGIMYRSWLFTAWHGAPTRHTDSKHGHDAPARRSYSTPMPLLLGEGCRYGVNGRFTPPTLLEMDFCSCYGMDMVCAVGAEPDAFLMANGHCFTHIPWACRPNARGYTPTVMHPIVAAPDDGLVGEKAAVWDRRVSLPHHFCITVLCEV